MMASMTISSIAILASTILLLIILPQTSGDLISKTCTNTQNDRLCATTLRRDSRSKNAGLATLALIIVDAIQEKANQTHEYIRNLQKSNVRLANALMVCNENYIVVLKIDVPKAAAKDPRIAEHGMEDAEVEGRECEGSFDEEMKELPLNEMNKNVYELANVGLTIIRIMLHRKNMNI